MSDNQYLELTVGMKFSDVDALNEHRLAYSRQQNISIVTKKSDYKCGFISWKCKHGGVYRQAKGAMNGDSSEEGNQIEGCETKTFRMGCPYLVNIYRRQASKVIHKAERWVITSMMDQHNHPLAGCLSTYVMNRKVVGDQDSHVDKLLASRGSNQVIISNCKVEFGDRSNLLAKDISNMRYRRTGVTEDLKVRRIFNFISKLQEAGYDVRWAVNEKNELPACSSLTTFASNRQDAFRRWSLLMQLTRQTGISYLGQHGGCRQRLLWKGGFFDDVRRCRWMDL
ncbi:hypothetical protein BC941DRAFT_232529 [Chlamydoabsidia padenii]|nr:hypothetical protein BC941DRAFT_232529 [Chlamydoabsidia padenii]